MQCGEPSRLLLELFVVHNVAILHSTQRHRKKKRNTKKALFAGLPTSLANKIGDGYIPPVPDMNPKKTPFYSSESAAETTPDSLATIISQDSCKSLVISLAACSASSLSNDAKEHRCLYSLGVKRTSKQIGLSSCKAGAPSLYSNSRIALNLAGGMGRPAVNQLFTVGREHPTWSAISLREIPAA